MRIEDIVDFVVEVEGTLISHVRQNGHNINLNNSANNSTNNNNSVQHHHNNVQLNELNNNNNEKNEKNGKEMDEEIETLKDSSEQETDECATSLIPDVLKHELDRIISEAEKEDWSKGEEEDDDDDEEEESSSSSSSSETSHSSSAYYDLGVIEECDEEEEEVSGEEESEDSEYGSDSDATITNESIEQRIGVENSSETAAIQGLAIEKDETVVRSEETGGESGSSSTSQDEIDEGKIVAGNAGHARGETEISTEEQDYPDGESNSPGRARLSTSELLHSVRENNSVQEVESVGVWGAREPPPPPLYPVQSPSSFSAVPTTKSTSKSVSESGTGSPTKTISVKRCHYLDFITATPQSTPILKTSPSLLRRKTDGKKKSVKFADEFVQSTNRESKLDKSERDQSFQSKEEEESNTQTLNNNKTPVVNETSTHHESPSGCVLNSSSSSVTNIKSVNSSASPSSEYFVLKYLAQEQQKQLDLIDLSRFCRPKQVGGGVTAGAQTTTPTTNQLDNELIFTFDSGKELSQFIEANTAGSYFSDNNHFSNGEMHQRLSSSVEGQQQQGGQQQGNHHHHHHVHTHGHGHPHQHGHHCAKPRSVLRKPGGKKSGRNVTFNESLNLFYEADECSCWIHEDDYARLRHEDQAQALIYEQATSLHHIHHHQHHNHIPHHSNFIYEPPPLEFEDTPTLSPPEGYKDRFFPQDPNPDVTHQTRKSPPSPPQIRRKVFLKENSTDQQNHHNCSRPILNGLDEEEEDENTKQKGSRFGGILKGGRLWRSNSSESKKVTSPSDEPDVVKCTEKGLADKDAHHSPGENHFGASPNQVQIVEPKVGPVQEQQVIYAPNKVSTGTATLRTSEQIRLAVDSTLRLSRSKKNKTECSSLVEKLRWLTSLDDEDSSDSQSGFATWPSRDKNGISSSTSSSLSTSNSSSSRKSDAGTSTNEEFVQSAIRHPPSIASANEAKIKQISYTLEDIDEGLKGGEHELETFITEDGGRIERIRKRYGEDIGGDDYGFSRRPSVKGIKPKFSSTNQIFAQFTAMRQSGAETPIPRDMIESQYENTRAMQQQQQIIVPQGPPSSSSSQQQQSQYEPLGSINGSSQMEGGARVNLNYDQYQSLPVTAGGGGGGGGGGPPPDSRSSHFEMIRQSFEQASYVNYNRPHSWSVSTLPHPHAHVHSNSISGGGGGSPAPPTHIPLPGMTNNLSGSSLNIGGGATQGQPQQPQNNLSINHNSTTSSMTSRPNSMPMMTPQQQTLYGTLPSQSHMAAAAAATGGESSRNGGGGAQPIYGTVRRVPNVIGRPLFLHYGALSVEAHPNKLVQPYPPAKVPETPSPTQQPPPIKYYGPPIRYYSNPPPPVPPRSATTTIGSGAGGIVIPGAGGDCVLVERGNPEGATDEEPSIKEPYSMNV